MSDDAIFTRAESFARDHAVTDDQRRALSLAFRLRRAQLGDNARSADDLDCIFVPRWVYHAVRGDDAGALPLAIATALLWTGIDLFDDVMDGDLPPALDGAGAAEISLAAVTLISALAPLALSLAPTAAATTVAMQQTLARGLLRMSAGQQLDVTTVGSAMPSVEAATAAAAGKTGEGVAMLATLAAQFAGASAAATAEYAAMGQALGCAVQLHSDIFDLFLAGPSRDLAHGARTFPVAWHAERLTAAERGRFIDLLDRARRDPAARARVRAELKDAGAVHAGALRVERYCEEARQALRAAGASGAAAVALRGRIEMMSLFPVQPHAQSHEEVPVRWHLQA